ncbi:hypothetical protein EX30DRAFT_118309 [Ascodesmis nigricans]|uniref:Uncharacterized protein n=1 Tax=Ascodesmis nigricans TaxID=341454 RepID=A0A4S2MPN6_9PEZI|nr:hypothetical protein EX30DRAFT_118309 [Ascodesmis nigricans]
MDGWRGGWLLGSIAVVGSIGALVACGGDAALALLVFDRGRCFWLQSIHLHTSTTHDTLLLRLTTPPPRHCTTLIREPIRPSHSILGVDSARLLLRPPVFLTLVLVVVVLLLLLLRLPLIPPRR